MLRLLAKGQTSRSRRVRLAGSLLLAWLTCASLCFSQSAADKATARQLATEGIQLYQGGDYAAALDRLQRAQSLYDAPVHLLYIARSNAQLNQLVEGAEAYRRLSRVVLDAGAPQAFRDAVSDGKTELDLLVPKIPALRVDVAPPNVEGLELAIDSSPVSAAIVGVDRPINPGDHLIQVRAPGYHPAQATVSIAIGEKKAVSLLLEPAPEAAEAPGPALEGEAPSEGEEAQRERGKIGFMAGLRLGGALPIGEVQQDENMSDYFGPGGGVEVHAGVRFLDFFTGVLLAQFQTFKPGPELDDLSRFDGAGRDIFVTSGTKAIAFGLGFMVGTPPGQMGGFGEIDLLLENFSHSQDLSDSGSGFRICGDSWTTDVTFSGLGLRLAGGGSFPVAKFLMLTPMAGVTVGQFSKDETNDPCSITNPGLEPVVVDLSGDRQRVHTTLFLGVGADFVFGSDL